MTRTKTRTGTRTSKKNKMEGKRRKRSWTITNKIKEQSTTNTTKIHLKRFQPDIPDKTR